MHFLLSYLYELKHQKLRMFLTIMGVAWGMANVALMLSVGEGLYRMMETGLAGMGEGIVVVWPSQSTMTWQGIGPGRPARVTEEDVAEAEKLPSIEHIGVEYTTWASNMWANGNVTSKRLRGVSPVYAELRNMTPEPGGRFINELDIKRRRRVIFIGNEVRDILFGEGVDPVGETLWLNENPFTIIGVMKEKIQMSMYNGSDAESVVIPSSTYRTMYNRSHVDVIIMSPVSKAASEEAKTSFRQLIAARQGFHPDDDAIVNYWDTYENMVLLDVILRGLQGFLGIMGGLTLLIAGIGVANIMFVTVKERTREIGIKMAVGAHPTMIVIQFLIEAVITVSIGGALGIAMTLGLIELFQYVPFPAEFIEETGRPEPVFSNIIALVCVTILNFIGLFSGLFPARNASLVDPVEALRYE